MSRISVLVFAPTSPSLSTNSRPATPDSASTLTPYEFALLFESHRTRLSPFRRPYSVVFTRHNPHPTPSTNHPYINAPILKIHIATTKTPSLLSKTTTLLSSSSTTNSSTTTTTTSSSPEDWLHHTLHTLQHALIVQRFSVSKFTQFVTDTLLKISPPGASVRRLSNGTTEIDYLALLSSNAEVKKMLNPDPEREGDGDGNERVRSVCGFRVSKGGRDAVLTDYRNGSRNGWERRDDPYGGLM